MVYVFLAKGFEEVEAIAPIDMMRRAGLAVTTVGIGGAAVTGSHGMTIHADVEDASVDLSDMEAVVLPGGMPGTLNLEASACVQAAISEAVRRGVPVAAICAAPSILGHLGLLEGVRSTCYPGFEPDLKGAVIAPESVVTDGLFTTAKGAGVAVDFGLELVKRLVDEDTAKELRKAIQCP